MNTELVSIMDLYEKEKGIPRKEIAQVIEAAITSAARKASGPVKDLRTEVNIKTGEIRSFAKLKVVEKVFNAFEEISVEDAQRINPEVEAGDEIEKEIDSRTSFGRVAAKTAFQALNQRIRQIELELIYKEFRDRAGEIVSGTVSRFDRSDVIINLGKFDGIMPQKERVSSEDYNVGEAIRVYVVAVENTHRGPQIILSRSHPNLVRRLFQAEVSEIADNTVEIKAIAREAGFRSKVAVASKDDKVDPVGACVGMGGARVRSIVRELNNEKVDIIRWSDNIEEFVTEALKPAKIQSLELDEKNKAITITVDEDQLSLAIGRRGQNARLTSRLIGWDVNIKKDETKKDIFDNQIAEAADNLTKQLGIDADFANKIVMMGMSDLETIVESEPAEIAEAIDEDLAKCEKIHALAKSALEARANSHAQ